MGSFYQVIIQLHLSLAIGNLIYIRRKLCDCYTLCLANRFYAPKLCRPASIFESESTRFLKHVIPRAFAYFT